MLLVICHRFVQRTTIGMERRMQKLRNLRVETLKNYYYYTKTKLLRYKFTSAIVMGMSERLTKREGIWLNILDAATYRRPICITALHSLPRRTDR